MCQQWEQCLLSNLLTSDACPNEMARQARFDRKRYIGKHTVRHNILNCILFETVWLNDTRLARWSSG